MNRNSLAYNIVNNQARSSWIDDPFNTIDAFKGLKGMSNEKNLSNFAQELVADYSKYDNGMYYLFLDMLPEDSQNELVRLYIESIDREIESACNGLDESINNDFMCAMLALLKNDCKENRDHFAEITLKNLLNYYKESLEDLLYNACNDFLYNTNNEQGIYANNDDSGDVIWGKF